MVTTADEVDSLDSDLNVKKRRTTAGDGGCDISDPIRRTVLATTEFYRGLAEAMAEALRSFNAELDTGDSSKNLSTAFVDGVAEGNARFYEEIAATSRRAFEHLKNKREEPAPKIVVLDYEKLARLVAAELRKSDPNISMPSDA